METQTSVKIDNGVDVEIDVDKEVSNKLIYSKEALQALREKKAANTKALKKVDKSLEKEEERAKSFTPEKVEALKLQAEKALQVEGERLAREVEQSDKDITARQDEVDALQAKTAKAIQHLETIQGISGLHRNSPKKLAASPWAYAIPISLIGSMEALYPGQWVKCFDNGKAYMYKSLRGQVWVDFSDFTQVKVTKGFGKRQTVYTRNYSQGLTKWFRTLLNTIMPKAA